MSIIFNRFFTHLVFGLLFCIIISCGMDQANIEYTNGALTPQEGLESITAPPGFKVELVVSEPLINDPVDMVIDENGKFYVVEMHGYPLDKSGQGRIKLLSDTDGDGAMDESKVFADNLMWPFGIMRWKNGVIVADAPQILYLEDSDGDGVADIRDTLLTGFAFSNAQMNAGGPIYGLDNWIYLTSEAGGSYQLYNDLFGQLGTEVYFPNHPEGDRLPPQGSGRTVRFDPDTYEIELTSGSTQFSRAFDEWGRHLLSNNSNHVYHEVIAAPYLSRNENLLVPYATQSISDHGSKVYSITTRPQTQLLTNAGVFTSACGITAYKGGAFPAPYDQSLTFVAEPVSNIVHVDVLHNKNTSFTASRIETPTKEFLASTDYWFRPVNMYTGPDGALYVLDYYRQIIEHPEWMSEEAIESGDLYHGSDMGRIYRITYEGQDMKSWTENLPLSEASSSDLVRYLSHPNSWWRMNAQRLLIDRNDQSAVRELKQIIRNSEVAKSGAESAKDAALGRLHALWTLDGMGQMDQEMIEAGLTDPVAGVRENAIRIAEKHLEDYPDLISTLVTLKDDENPKVRFQLLCTLGYDNSEQSKEARSDILFRDIGDTWVQIAALSAESFQAADVLDNLINDYSKDKSQYNSLIARLSELLVTGGETAYMSDILRKAISHLQASNGNGWENTVLHGLAKGIRQNKDMVQELGEVKPALLEIFLRHDNASARGSALDVLSAIGVNGMLDTDESLKTKLVAMAGDTDLPGERRAEIIRFISLTGPENIISFYENLINPEEDAAVQLAALNAMNGVDGVAMSDFVLSNWDRLSPQIRQAAVQAHLSSAGQVNLFLDAIENGTVQKSAVDFYRRVRYMTYPDDAIKRRARAIFSQKEEGELNEEYKAVLDMQGDKENGQLVFEKNCAICHQVDGEIGKAIGPDLNTVYSWSPEGIVSQVLFPGASVAVGYELWQIQLQDGDQIQGVIVDESPTAITVRNVGMEDQIISRSSVKSLQTLEYSMMPGGWEEIISVEEMADLVAFLKRR